MRVRLQPLEAPPFPSVVQKGDEDAQERHHAAAKKEPHTFPPGNKKPAEAGLRVFCEPAPQPLHVADMLAPADESVHAGAHRERRNAEHKDAIADQVHKPSSMEKDPDADQREQHRAEDYD